MLRLRCLFLLTLFLPATARRSFRVRDSHQYAQRQNDTLSKAFKVSAAAREGLLPGGLEALFRLRGQRAGALPGARRPFGPRQARAAVQSKELRRAFQFPDGTAAAHEFLAMRTAMPLAMRDVGSRRTANVVMAEGPPKFEFSLQSLILALITAQSAYGLVVEDVPTLSSADPNFVQTAFDLGFLIYGINILSRQLGVQPTLGNVPSLAGLDCSVTMSVGREPGTWMPEEWAASGARLSLPLSVRFSDEPVDLGIPGEEALGGRNAKRLECEGGSFVGLGGVIKVAADGGAWSVLPTGREGEGLVRFFIDFPEGATRNDVNLPAGRVFFSSVCFDSEERRAAADLGQGEVVEAPSGTQLLADGGLTIKRNNFRNLWGALGDANLILGRFTVRRNTSSPQATVPMAVPARRLT